MFVHVTARNTASFIIFSMFKNICCQTLYWECKLSIVYSAWKVKMEISFMKMPFFIVLYIAIVVPMSHPLPWNGPYTIPNTVASRLFCVEIR